MVGGRTRELGDMGDIRVVGELAEILLTADGSCFDTFSAHSIHLLKVTRYMELTFPTKNFLCDKKCLFFLLF